MPLYVTHVYAHSPHYLPKKVTQKQPVNHIGSSDEPPINVSWKAGLLENFVCTISLSAVQSRILIHNVILFNKLSTLLTIVSSPSGHDTRGVVWYRLALLRNAQRQYPTVVFDGAIKL